MPYSDVTRFDYTTRDCAFMHDHSGKFPMEAPAVNGSFNKFVRSGSSAVKHHKNEALYTVALRSDPEVHFIDTRWRQGNSLQFLLKIAGKVSVFFS